MYRGLLMRIITNLKIIEKIQQYKASQRTKYQREVQFLRQLQEQRQEEQRIARMMEQQNPIIQVSLPQKMIGQQDLFHPQEMFLKARQAIQPLILQQNQQEQLQDI